MHRTPTFPSQPLRSPSLTLSISDTNLASYGASAANISVNCPSPFKLAFQALETQLEDYHKMTALVIEENNRLKCDNNALQQGLVAVQSRIQELESSLTSETMKRQHDANMDKDRICRLSGHVVQLQHFTQSLVSLDFKQYPSIDHTACDLGCISNTGVGSDGALVDVIVEAVAQGDSPWARIHSAVLKSHTSPPEQSLRRLSCSSSDRDTASTTSSQAYRHDAPPVLNNILSELKIGLFPVMKRANDDPAQLRFPSSSDYMPITHQQALSADVPMHQIGCGSFVMDPKHLHAPSVASVLPTEIFSKRSDVKRTPLSPRHEPIDRQNTSTLFSLDISAEKIDDIVEQLVSSFSSSSFGSLEESSKSDCKTLREWVGDHLENVPGDLCKLEHNQRALVEEVLCTSGERQCQASEGLNSEIDSESGGSGDLTLLCPSPLGLINLPLPDPPSVKAVTWGGISVQNISSSETSSLASSSSLGSITSPPSDGPERGRSNSKQGQSASESVYQQSPRSPEKGSTLEVERVKKPRTRAVKGSTIPTSILKKSALPTKSATSAVKSRPAVEKHAPVTLRSLPPYPHPSSPLTVNPVPAKISTAVQAPISQALSFIYEDCGPTTNALALKSSFTSVACGVNSADGPILSSETNGSLGRAVSGHKSKSSTMAGSTVASIMPSVSLSGRLDSLSPGDVTVISRSTVGSTDKHKSSGSWAPKKSRVPTILSSSKTTRLSSPPPTSSAFRQKCTFVPPSRRCADTSRSFLAVPTKIKQGKMVSSPLPPALCTPSTASLLSPSLGKTHANAAVPYHRPATPSPLSQHVITALPLSDSSGSSHSSVSAATFSNVGKFGVDQRGPFPQRRQGKVDGLPPCGPTGQSHTPVPMSHTAGGTSCAQGQWGISALPNDQQKRSRRPMPASLIPTISEQSTLTTLQYRRLFQGNMNLGVR